MKSLHWRRRQAEPIGRLPDGVTAEGGGETGAQYGVIAAYGTLIIIPSILFALVVNRYIVSGLTQGAVKG